MNIEIVTLEDKKYSIDMVLAKEFPNANYRFLNGELIWEDIEIARPTDEWLSQKQEEYNATLTE